MTASTSAAATGTATSTGGGEPATANLAHVCSIFPKADAERITGIALQAGSDTGHECSYDRADSPDHLAVATVAIDTGPNQRQQFAFDRSHPIGTDTLTDVSGVGDGAYYSAGFKMLVLIKGDNLLHISITDTSIANPQAVDTQIAAVVLAILG